MGKVRFFVKKCKRVWNTLKKPSKDEFQMTAKVSAIGILVLGLFGFIVSFLVKLF
jgi:protein translocase SEC61 complex gamma subunit